MMIRTLLFISFAAAGLAFWRAEAAAELQQRTLLRSLASQWEPFGTLSHRQTRAHFWGSGEIDDLSFVPSDQLRRRYGLSPDLKLSIPRVRYSGLRQPNGETWPSSISVTFHAAHLSVNDPWPKSVSGGFEWHYGRDDGELFTAINLDSPETVKVQASVLLKLAQVASFSGAALSRAKLNFSDLGLAQNLRADLVSRLGADTNNADDALAAILVQWLNTIGIPPDESMRNELLKFAREPLSLTIELEPPGKLRPETLFLFAPNDRVAALGLSIKAP